MRATIRLVAVMAGAGACVVGVHATANTPAGANDAPRDSLAFVRDAGTAQASVWRVAVAGGRARRLIAGAFDPAADPAGRRLAFARLRNAGAHLGVLDLRSGRGRSVPLPSRWVIRQPAWSPDGRRLAFTRLKSEQEIGSVGEPPAIEILYVVRADGRGLRRIARGAVPTWAPDGRRLAAVGEDGCLDILRLDGTITRKLRCGGAGSPSWSPDGRLIAYTRTTVTASFWCTIFPVTDCRQITDGSRPPPGAGGPASDSASDLFVIRPDGRGRRRLTANRPLSESQMSRRPAACDLHRHSASHPTWSPDSRRLAYAGDDGLHIFTLRTRNDRRVSGGCPGATPTWIATGASDVSPGSR